MYLSDRVKQAANLMLNQSLGISVTQLSLELDISERTTYRLLKSLESSIQKLDIKIKKKNGMYILSGTVEKTQLLREILEESAEALSNKERQMLILLDLLSNNEPIKKDSFVIDYHVSKGTIDQDLKTVVSIYESYGLRIVSKKGSGIIAELSELNKRVLYSHLIGQGINDFEFFELLITNSESIPDNPFFSYFSYDDVSALYCAMKEKFSIKIDTQNDTRLKNFLLYVDYTFNCIQKNNYLTTEAYELVKRDDEDIFEQILDYYCDVKSIEYVPHSEKVILFNQWYGIYQNEDLDNKIDYIETSYGYKVNQLILNVSNKMRANYYLDDSLYNDLFVHIKSAIYRARVTSNVEEVAEDSIVLQDIKTKFPKLYQVVECEVRELFFESQFSEGEILYIVLHFASMETRIPRNSQAKVLLVCSAGMGTSKMLENTIRKYFPEVQDITTTSIVELLNSNVDDYDLIVSTSYLKGFEKPYRVVSSILLEQDLVIIRDELNKVNQKNVPKRVESIADDLEFDNFVEVVNISNNIVSNFQLQLLDNQDLTLEETLEIISIGIFNDEDKAKSLTEMLLERMSLAPIGFPETSMAFFHGVDKNVKQPYFLVYDLKKPYTIKDFNDHEMTLTRILFMIGRKDCELDLKALGWVSSSIVDSTSNMTIYNEGNKQEIEELLQQTIMQKLQKE